MVKRLTANLITVGGFIFVKSLRFLILASCYYFSVTMFCDTFPDLSNIAKHIVH